MTRKRKTLGSAGRLEPGQNIVTLETLEDWTRKGPKAEARRISRAIQKAKLVCDPNEFSGWLHNLTTAAGQEVGLLFKPTREEVKRRFKQLVDKLADGEDYYPGAEYIFPPDHLRKQKEAVAEALTDVATGSDPAPSRGLVALKRYRRTLQRWLRELKGIIHELEPFDRQWAGEPYRYLRRLSRNLEKHYHTLATPKPKGRPSLSSRPMSLDSSVLDFLRWWENTWSKDKTLTPYGFYQTASVLLIAAYQYRFGRRVKVPAIFRAANLKQCALRNLPRKHRRLP